jgi:hypothetical protein
MLPSEANLLADANYEAYFTLKCGPQAAHLQYFGSHG